MGYGKWLGGVLGWAVGGPIGALMGFAFGSMFEDNTLSAERQTGQQGNYRRGQTTAGDFAASLLVLSAAIMKADGKILKSELNFVRNFFERQFGKAAAEQHMLLLRDILKQDIPLKQVSEQIRFYMDHSARLQLLHYLFGIALADQNVDETELRTIEQIASYLGISNKDFISIRAMFYKDTDSAFEILEIDKNATNDEVKKAYRKMAMKYHPDKLKDLGDAHKEAAEAKFIKVQEAYETIKKKRGIK